ncbi:hypothetical protein CDAR_70561 [Caerostris darwini]|uniref:Uncharacterized protein n=1 Tax=Caerostris darwini TaxID=1538125 RepID=A0AAV4WFR0_9ARAC|nr:hypothetical protein CDAR_70561 [Caerostris darwini]
MQNMLETDVFSDYEHNISDDEEEDDDYVDSIDNGMGKSDEILMDEEMPVVRSRNRRRVRAIISSSDEDELHQQIPICRKKAKLNNHMWFNECHITREK